MGHEDSIDSLLNLIHEIQDVLPDRRAFKSKDKWVEAVSIVLENKMGIKLPQPQLKKLWEDAQAAHKRHSGGCFPSTPPGATVGDYAVLIAVAWLNTQGQQVRVLF